MHWRESEPYLATEYLDGDSAELLDIVSAELPFERVRDGNVTAWVLRAGPRGPVPFAMSEPPVAV